MLTFIILFFPAALSLLIYEGLIRREMSVKKSVYMYCAFNLFVNFLCWTLMRLVLNTAYNNLYDQSVGITPAVAGDYLLLAIPAAVILPVLAALLNRNVKISLEEPENEK